MFKTGFSEHQSEHPIVKYIELPFTQMDKMDMKKYAIT